MRKNKLHDLWKQVALPEHTGTDECWEWQGKRTKLGYGQIKIVGRWWLTHRLAYLITRDPEDAEEFEKLKVLHRCDNRRCCNPAHLFLGTQRDNMLDMQAKGRKAPPPKGEECHTAKLTEEKVLEIRRMQDQYTLAEFAEMHNVTPQAIYAVLTRRSWKHI